MGSGHIICYLFDVLMQIYEVYGYTSRDAVLSIVKNNLYGLDIDDRAAQLAYFSIMMKACQYDKRFLKRKVQPHLFSILESNDISSDCIDYFADNDPILKKDISKLICELYDAKEYGSILKISKIDFSRVYSRFNEIENNSPTIYTHVLLNQLLPLVRVAEVMSRRYQVVITNPPYLASPRMNDKLLSYIKDNYEEGKADFSTVMFLAAQRNLLANNGLISFITTNSWMYLKSFLKARKESLRDLTFLSIVDYGTELFEGKIGHLPIVAWVSRKSKIKIKFHAVRLVDYRYSKRNEKFTAFFEEKNHYYSTQAEFSRIDGSPIDYWISDNVLESFKSKNIESIAEIVSGMTTGNNDRYLREWHELNINNIAFNKINIKEIDLSKTKWIPYHKGGEQRKWYGNIEYVVNWADKDNFNRAKTTMTHVYLKPCITWSDISGNTFAGRYCAGGFLFDVKGSCAFSPHDNNLKILIGIFNSKIMPVYVEALNPTSTTQVGDLKRVPYIEPNQEQAQKIISLVNENIAISKQDWDSFENSWKFQKSPLISHNATIKDSFFQWQSECASRLKKIKINEEELNSIFINIYGLQNELTPWEEDKDATIRKADLNRDIKSFISYAVGCMFGRYSLDVDGLAYAGGAWDRSKYQTFLPDEDNVIPIADEEYLEDDIVGLFVKFVKVVYGEKTLEQNLTFIADALGAKGKSSREIIRNYFLKDFFKDHCKTYQKRPIYWLYDSGKQDGFKALVYLHRMDENTTGKVRADYLHRMEQIYTNEISRMQDTIEHSKSAHEASMAEKRVEKLKKQVKECQDYDAKLGHLALDQIKLDLDDGVKVNYRKAQTSRDGKFYEVLADSKKIMANDKLWQEYLTEWPHEDD